MSTRKFKDLINVYLSVEDIHGVFGIILFDERSPFVKKVLRDEDYWRSLDVISGPRWPIFAICPSPGRYVDINPSSDPETLHMMIPLNKWVEPGQNKMILEYLEIENTETLPLLLIFCEDTKGNLLKTAFKIDDSDEEKCYKSLKDALVAVSDSIKKVSESNIKNTMVIYNLMSTGLKQHIFWSRMKKGLNIVSWIKGLLP